MTLVINGKEKEINAGEITIEQILILLEVKSAEMVSVQLNNKFIRKEEYSTTFLKEMDEIDFLYFMGGGE